MQYVDSVLDLVGDTPLVRLRRVLGPPASTRDAIHSSVNDLASGSVTRLMLIAGRLTGSSIIDGLSRVRWLPRPSGRAWRPKFEPRPSASSS